MKKLCKINNVNNIIIFNENDIKEYKAKLIQYYNSIVYFTEYYNFFISHNNINNKSMDESLNQILDQQLNKEFNISLLKYQLEISSKEEYKSNKELSYLLKYEKIHQEYHLKRKKIREVFKNHVSDGADTSKENDLIAKSDINGVIEFKNVSHILIQIPLV